MIWILIALNYNRPETVIWVLKLSNFYQPSCKTQPIHNVMINLIESPLAYFLAFPHFLNSTGIYCKNASLDDIKGTQLISACHSCFTSVSLLVIYSLICMSAMHPLATTEAIAASLLSQYTY